MDIFNFHKFYFAFLKIKKVLLAGSTLSHRYLSKLTMSGMNPLPLRVLNLIWQLLVTPKMQTPLLHLW